MEYPNGQFPDRLALCLDAANRLLFCAESIFAERNALRVSDTTWNAES